MKHFLSTLILFTIFFSANAQLTKGKISIGGGLGFNVGSSPATSTKLKATSTNLFIQPQVGYFFKDKLEGYVFAGYGRAEDKEASNKSKKDSYGGGLGVTKYISITDKFAFFAGPQLSFFQEKDEQSTKTKKLDARLFGGFAFFPTSKIGLKAAFGGLGYAHTTEQEKGATEKVTTDSFGLNANSSNINFGFSFYF